MSSTDPASLPSRLGPFLVSGSPRQRVLLLVFCSAFIRLIFAASVNLGVDESYLVATGRQLALSTYDHPPIAWWIGWSVSHITGSDASLTIRLPFILLFVGTTWQMYRLASFLFDEEAGFWSALALNCAPVLGVTSATWAVPDAPLMLALVSGALCLSRVLFEKSASPYLWLGAGAWGGVALLSKYHGIFLFAGSMLFLLSCAPHRRWLKSPWPYLGALLAALVFSPVVIWNAQHEWASFGFQGGRGAATHWRLWMPFVALAGQALFLFPPLWLALVVFVLRAIRVGPSDDRKWLLVCLGIGPVALFTIASAWSHSVFFHWAAPGYLMWIPLLGQGMGAWFHAAGTKKQKCFTLSALTIPALVLCVSTLAALPVRWVSLIGRDPFVEIRDMEDLRSEIERRGFLTPDTAFIAGVKWHQTGRLDYALHGAIQVTCLCDDARGYGIIAPIKQCLGKSGIVITPGGKAEALEKKMASEFDHYERLENLQHRHNGEVISTFSVYRVVGLHRPR